jgi:thiamine biosynthesis lipoprotein ApbE
MAAQRNFPLSRRVFGVVACLFLTACQQPPAEVDGHKVTKTKRVNGKDVNMLGSTDKDLDEVRAEAKEMKKTSDTVVFTPEEQQAGK